MIEILYSTSRAPKPTRLETAKKGSWIYVVDPSDDELELLSETYKLDIDLLSDALDIYETPRVERDGQTSYVFARYAYPEGRDIATEPMLIIYAADHLFTILRTETKFLSRLKDGVEPIATSQKTKTFLQVLGAINYSYDKNMHQVGKYLLTIRSKLSKAEIKNENIIEFIDMEENLNEYLTALQPQAVMLSKLLGGRFLPLYEEDKDLVEDLSLSTTELIDLINSRLKTISSTREAYATITANMLNKTFRRLTSISIFLMIPTIVAALYGMNLSLPLADNPDAFWIILVIVMSLTAATVFIFRKLRLL